LRDLDPIRFFVFVTYFLAVIQSYVMTEVLDYSIYLISKKSGLILLTIGSFIYRI